MQLMPGAAVEVFEAGGRWGGVLDTRFTDRLLIERGADSFFNKLPWAADLCQELGLADELIPTSEGNRSASVLCRGRLHPVPEGFVVYRPQRLGPMIRSPILSWRGKLRMLLEGWVRSPPDLHSPDYDESVGSFATRQLGAEVFQRLVQPLLAGIYTADPHKLSLAATMPEAIEALREFGSLRNAARARSSRGEAEASGPRYASFVTLRRGLAQLVEALASRLAEHAGHLNAPVRGLLRGEDGSWSVEEVDGTRHGPFQGVVLALPAPRAAELVHRLDSHLGRLLEKIPYASSAVVSLVFERGQIAEDVSGFGFVVPTVERRKILAASFSSQKFPGRAADDQLLIRVFVGGALQPELLQLSDDALCELARAELSEILKVRGQPRHVEMARWPEKMPQYHVGHVKLVADIQRQIEQLQGLEVAGNAYHGVGIPQCVHSGEGAARRLADSMQPPPTR